MRGDVKMKRILMIAAFTSCLLISAAALSFADTDEAYRQKQLEQSPDYYSEENQKEIAELQKKVDDYMYLKKQLESISGILFRRKPERNCRAAGKSKAISG